MIEDIKLDIYEAIEAGAEAICNLEGIKWEDTNTITRLHFRHLSIVSVKAATPFIVEQILKDIASRTYDVE